MCIYIYIGAQILDLQGYGWVSTNIPLNGVPSAKARNCPLRSCVTCVISEGCHLPNEGCVSIYLTILNFLGVTLFVKD
jgi:hypothetical protein